MAAQLVRLENLRLDVPGAADMLQAVGGSTPTLKRACHVPFKAGIKGCQLIPGLNVLQHDHLHGIQVKETIWVAAVVGVSKVIQEVYVTIQAHLHCQVSLLTGLLSGGECAQYGAFLCKALGAELGGPPFGPPNHLNQRWV
eukprot:CAMPEP_0174370324 /NCGR_PEP_ID=MMETSP0811_2-20130205/95732_1 /TAXON_ID=73025 ORGANISM="Eutreptiella gymnastica-like, Strain CCMP1594" /NCGR_SAMPLE_ID=MMETSP0811_2 /ASSEMBLY_ACC=CAM_ASM_000667 /LENGTH=140 /DNA_ID=CAMNT_0015515629 /DNA_START=76 /DNA_END=498 /DNA_ORIENTATION=+